MIAKTLHRFLFHLPSPPRRWPPPRPHPPSRSRTKSADTPACKRPRTARCSSSPRSCSSTSSTSRRTSPSSSARSSSRDTRRPRARSSRRPMIKIRPFSYVHAWVGRDGRADEADGSAQSLVLENLSHPFLKPNILDVKLGTVLHDEDASDEKRARMEKTARETTSFETGIRLTGFQVYDNTTAQPVTTPKSYGKTIAAADLPDGVARFFPVAPAPATLSPDAPNRGLPARLLLPILAAIKDEIEDISDALSGVELRMVGGSLLVLYEADWARAEGGLRWLEKHAGDEEGEEDDEEEGEEEGEGGEKKPGPPFVVKLIDFAHTRLKPGSGPDEGVLKDIETFLQLLEGRIEQVKKAVAASSEG
ncbi:inositol polyphosphate kinase-domain-containing protein [Amylostereum chailletii]|nr:inositol polyphosphate kinase-domain-containing protein [Amylostereum chailletii]